MEPAPQRTPTNRQHRRPLAAAVTAYLVIGFGFAWAAWILAIKHSAGEELLNIGTAGPALAAMVLSRTYQSTIANRSKRVLTFLATVALGWVVLSFRYAPDSNPLHLHLRSLLLLPALFPAWICPEFLRRMTTCAACCNVCSAGPTAGPSWRCWFFRCCSESRALRLACSEHGLAD
jgi:hypothetical protein